MAAGFALPVSWITNWLYVLWYGFIDEEEIESHGFTPIKHGKMSLKYEEITEAIIGAAFEVYNILGYGFLEKVYQRALQVELLRRGH